MAEITNPEAVRFCNEQARALATQIGHTYRMAKRVASEWTANPQLATLIAFDNAALVVDGAAQDGRHPATGVNVNNVLSRGNELIADLEADGGAKLNTILALAHPGT